jgi:hypothetical protein
MNNEIWKPVKNWKHYEVSNLGRIRRRSGFDTTGRWIDRRQVKIKRNGYVALSDKPKRVQRISVARLVLFAFEGPPPSLEENQARHLDDDRYNNKLDNLAWGSSWDNHQDRKRNGGTRKGIPRDEAARAAISLGNRTYRLKSKEGLYTIFGETKLLAEWLEDGRCFLDRSTLTQRIRRGWDLEEALITPKRDWKNGKFLRPQK